MLLNSEYKVNHRSDKMIEDATRRNPELFGNIGEIAEKGNLPASARKPAVRFSLVRVFLAVTWMTIVTGGMLAMIRYASAPGAASPSPSQWPARSHIFPDAKMPMLVMFAHPRCPCTKASVEELAQLAADCQGRFSAQVWFVKPAGTDNDWTNSSLWREAAAIPGVTAHCDNLGIEARIFGAETSGHTVLYDRDGRLLFQGGLTGARGHAGDNPGLDAVESFLKHEQFRQVRTAVYGCSLFSDESPQESSNTNQP